MNAEIAGHPSPPAQLARMADVRRGVRKGRKIRKVLEERLGPAPWRAARVLDYGCGPGTIAAYLARYAGEVTAVDVDEAALAIARGRYAGGNLEFVFWPRAELPFPDASFDVIVANHVYEHVADQQTFFRELRRLVKPRGAVYLAAAGRFQLVEPHYKLPFLSWLPAPLADRYMRLTRRGRRYDVRLLSYRRLLGLLARFDVEEFTAAIVARPAFFGARAELGVLRHFNRGAAAALRAWPALAPTRVFLLAAKES